MDYRRFISYLYNYVDGEKGVNVGYIRCEQRHGICRLTLNLQDRQQGVEGGSYKVYLYKISKEGNPVGYYLDEFTLSSGCGELKNRQTVRMYGTVIIGLRSLTEWLQSMTGDMHTAVSGAMSPCRLSDSIHIRNGRSRE